MRVVLYARVSSEKQAEKDLSIDAQIKALKKYAGGLGHKMVDIFIDKAESGRTANRPAFQKMMSLAKSENTPFEAVLVWKLNRFARSREVSILYKAQLRKNGVDVISINEPVDNSPAGMMLEGILESVDQFYSDNMALDIKRGMLENASRGFYNGGKAPFGYNIKKVKVGSIDKSKLTVDTNTSPIVEKIFSFYLDGEGAKNIAIYLNSNYLHLKTWSKKTVLGILRNEIYTGAMVWNRNCEDLIRVEETHPSIIDKDEFVRVQKILASRSPKEIHPRTVGSGNLLNGLLKCNSCKKAYTSYSAKSGAYHYYTCQSRFKSGKDVCSQGDFNIDKLDNLIIDRIKDRILTEDNIRELLDLINSEFGVIEKEIRGKLGELSNTLAIKEKARDRLFELVETTEELDYSDIAPRIKRSNKEISDIETNILEQQYKLAVNEPPKLTEEEIRPYLDELHQTLLHSSIVEQRNFIRSFIQKIHIDKESAIIEYTFPLSPKDNSKKEVLVLGTSGRA